MVTVSDEPVTLGRCDMCYENQDLYEITIGYKKLSISSGKVIEMDRKYHLCGNCKDELKANL